MTNNALLQAQHMVDQLAPLDQLRLLEYLTPRIVRVVELAQSSKPMSMTTHAEAWREFFVLETRLRQATTRNHQP
ncbi:MAG: hypothetical protein ABI874_07820 [Chloroflexota bacterium]